MFSSAQAVGPEDGGMTLPGAKRGQSPVEPVPCSVSAVFSVFLTTLLITEQSLNLEAAETVLTIRQYPPPPPFGSTGNSALRKGLRSLAVVEHAFNSGTLEAETGGSV